MKSRISLILLLLCVAGIGAATAGAAPSVITGSVLGADGKPMRAAHVHLIARGEEAPSASVAVSADGSYRISTDAVGIVMLQFTGVDHEMGTCRLMIATPHEITVNARLGTRAFGTAFDDVQAIGDFNGFSFRTGVPMKKNRDGTYTATVKASGPKMVYQLLFFANEASGSFSCNGTQSEAYEYDGGGDYRSIISAKKGRAVITFDPRKLPTGSITGTVEIRDPVGGRLSDVLAEMSARREKMSKLVTAWRKEGEKDPFPQPDWSADERSLRERIATETDPNVRGALELAYAALTYLGHRDLDSNVARRTLSDIPPTSPLWTVEPGLLNTVMGLTMQRGNHEAYRWDLIRHHPSAALRVQELYAAIGALSEDMSDEGKMIFYRYYQHMQEVYPKTREALYCRAEFDPNRPIRTGIAIPAFSVASLDEPSQMISNESMRGRIYLIDFWATWCGPCVAEMKNLHAVYEKYHHRNFTIVSLSFDESADKIAPFRAAKWPMPWLHTFVEGGFRSDLAKRFGVVGIPKPILVDASGTIIATENELRGAQLDKTLERVLGKEMSRRD